MNIWDILGISPTEDKSIIKKAYLAKLKVTHPEEKPEEFAKLKEAYDMAQEYKASEEIEKSEFQKDLEEVYFKFSKRVDIESWTELFDKYINHSTESLEDLVNNSVETIRNELLNFFLDNFKLPTPVWELIDKKFNIVFNKEELYTMYNPNFIDFIVSHIKYGGYFIFDYIKREEIDDSKDYDSFIDKSTKLERMVNREKVLDTEDGIREVALLLKELDDMEINYVKNEICKAEYIAVRYDEQAREEFLTKLCEDYKDYILPYLELGYKLLQVKKYEEAERIFNIANDLEENNLSVLIGFTRLYIETDRVIEADKFIDRCFEHEKYENSQMYINLLNNQLCEKLILHYKAIDEKNNHLEFTELIAISIAFICLGQYLEAIEYLERVLEEDRNPVFYYRYLDSCLNTENYEKFEKALRDLEKLVNGDISDNVSALVCQYYRKINEHEKAIEKCDEYINKFEDNLRFYFFKICNLKELKRYDEIIEIAEYLKSKNMLGAKIATITSEVFYDLYEYNRALEYIEIALSLDFYSVSRQRHKIKCLFDARYYNDTINHYKALLQTGLKDEVINLYAAKTYYRLRNYDEALDIVNKQLEEELENKYDFRALLGQIYDEKQEYEKALEIFENLYEEEIKYDTVFELARAYENLDLFDKSKNLLFNEIFGKDSVSIEEIKNFTYGNSDKYSIEQEKILTFRLGWTLYRFYEEFFIEAITLFEKNKDHGIYSTHLSYLGYSYRMIGENEKAIECFREYIDKVENVSLAWTYNNLIAIYKSMKDKKNIENTYEEAILRCSNEEYLYREYLDMLSKERNYEKCVEIILNSVKNKELKRFTYIYDLFEAILLKTGRKDDLREYLELFIERAINMELMDSEYLIHSMSNTLLDTYNEPARALEILNIALNSLYDKHGEDYDFSEGEDSYVILSLSKCYRLQNDMVLSKKYFEMGLVAKKESNKNCINFDLAIVYLDYGDIETALKHAKMAEKTVVEDGFCKSAPVCYHSYYILGKIYAAKKDNKKAIKYFNKYLGYQFSLYTEYMRDQLLDK